MGGSLSRVAATSLQAWIRSARRRSSTYRSPSYSPRLRTSWHRASTRHTSGQHQDVRQCLEDDVWVGGAIPGGRSAARFNACAAVWARSNRLSRERAAFWASPNRRTPDRYHVFEWSGATAMIPTTTLVALYDRPWAESAARERRAADAGLFHFIVRTTRNLALPDIIRS